MCSLSTTRAPMLHCRRRAFNFNSRMCGDREKRQRTKTEATLNSLVEHGHAGLHGDLVGEPLAQFRRLHVLAGHVAHLM